MGAATPRQHERRPAVFVLNLRVRFGLDEARELCRIQNETPAIDVRFDPARVSGEWLAGPLARPGDIILTVGAGDIYRAGEAICEPEEQQ